MKSVLINAYILKRFSACSEGIEWFLSFAEKWNPLATVKINQYSYVSFNAAFKKAPKHFKAWCLVSLPPRYQDVIFRDYSKSYIKSLLLTALNPKSGNSLLCYEWAHNKVMFNRLNTAAVAYKRAIKHILPIIIKNNIFKPSLIKLNFIKEPLV